MQIIRKSSLFSPFKYLAAAGKVERGRCAFLFQQATWCMRLLHASGSEGIIQLTWSRPASQTSSFCSSDLHYKTPSLLSCLAAEGLQKSSVPLKLRDGMKW